MLRLTTVLALLLLAIVWVKAEPDEEATISWEVEEEQEEQEEVELGTPQNLTVTNFTDNSIFLTWVMNSSYNDIGGYRVYYKHNYEDIKTVLDQKPEYLLSNLHPFTKYEVWVVPVGKETTETEGEASEKIFQTTNTAAPSSPFITVSSSTFRWNPANDFHL